jgi:putative MATE family efflux protein
MTTRRSPHRRILALAIPAIGTLVADPLLGAVDTAVAGRLGSSQLGALGLAVGILAAVTWIFNFLVLGTTTTVAHARGRGDDLAAGRRVAHAGVAAVALGVIVGIILAVTAPAIVRGFGAVDELVQPTVDYLRVRAVGVPFMLLGYVGHGAFRGVENTRTPLIVVVAANLLNGALDVILVFGLGFGLAGIAWATVAAEVLAVIAFAALIRRAGLPLTGHGLPSRQQIRDLVIVSRDLVIRTGGLLAGFLAITAAAARVDAVTAAAHQVIWQVFLLVSFMMDGFAIAAQALVGGALGRGDTEDARATARALIVWGVAGGTLTGLALLAGEPVVTRLFTTDAAVLAAIGSAWWLASLGHGINGVVFVLDGVAMGAADFRYLRTWTALAALTAAVLAQVGVSLGGGLLWLWICAELLMVMRGVSLHLRLRGRAWLASDLAAR